MESRNDRKGIEFLRYAVKLFNDCNEGFNFRFSAEELMKLAAAMEACDWDFYPDQWSQEQIEACLKHSKVPNWEYDTNGKLVPIASKQVFNFGSVKFEKI